MVAQIERENTITSGEAPAHGAPVVQRAEQAVQDDQWRAVAVRLIVQLHPRTVSFVARFIQAGRYRAQRKPTMLRPMSGGLA